MKWICAPLLSVLVGVSSVSAQTTRYVWTNSPFPAPPFTNWSTAARSIQEAVDACVPGDTVLVTNGVYSAGGRAAPGLILTNRVLISGAIVVQSINGPGATVIQGRGPLGYSAARCAYLTNGATLGGFRLEQGYTFDVASPSVEERSGGGAAVFAGCVLTNCQVASNGSSGYGGGVYGIGGTIVDCRMSQNESMDGGGIYLQGGSLRNCVLRDNQADPGNGGGAYVRDGTVVGCTFETNDAYWGGGLMLEGGSASGIIAVSNMAATGAGLAAAEALISDAQLLHNTAYASGGGAYLEMCWLSDSVVSNNDLCWQEYLTVGYGGGIASLISRIENCAILDNRGFDADDRGGGIACFDAGHWTNQLIDCAVRGNSAGDGGGIFVAPAAVCHLSATGTNAFDVRGNSATNFGGGVCTSTQAVFRASGRMRFAANRAAYGGGLAARAGSVAAIEEAGGEVPAIYGNTATNSGGGLFAAESSTLLALRDVQIGSGGDAIQGNAANGDASFSGGGGIALYSGAALLGTDVAFAFNECPHGFGGALLLYLAQAALASTPPSQPATDDPRTRFTDNRATNQHGGAIYAFDSQLSVQNAAFLGNLAKRGGAVHVDTGSTGRFGNVVMAGNVATESGGALRTFDGGGASTVCDLRHCTLFDNGTGGVSAGGSVALSLTNCIVTGNAGTQVSAGYSVAYSDVQGGYAGAGNVDADPSFRDAAAYDFHLTLGSIGEVSDTGTDAGLTNDCVFRARPLSFGYDMGAYEYEPDYDDSDGDGMADGWELEHGLDPANDADADAHGDADGIPNLGEYLADTDPQDPTDYFHLTDCAYNPARPDRGIFVGFTSSSNRLYSLYCAEALSNDCVWTAMPGKTNVPGVGSYDGFNDNDAPAIATSRTYRVTAAPIPR